MTRLCWAVETITISQQSQEATAGKKNRIPTIKKCCVTAWFTGTACINRFPKHIIVMIICVFFIRFCSFLATLLWFDYSKIFYYVIFTRFSSHIFFGFYFNLWGVKCGMQGEGTRSLFLVRYENQFYKSLDDVERESFTLTSLATKLIQ